MNLPACLSAPIFAPMVIALCCGQHRPSRILQSAAAVWMNEVELVMTLWKICVLTVFAIPISAWEFTEWCHVHAASKYPLVDGRIVNRTDYRRWGGVPATRLTIQTADGKVQVMAKETRHNTDRDSELVQFHYSGDPGREVFIEGGESP